MDSVSVNAPQTKGQLFRAGLRDGLPIGLGYFAVAFSLGILATSAGLNAFSGFVASLLTNASAGEVAAFTLMAERGTYLGMVLVTVVINARYLLMSTALSQRLPPDTPLRHRLGLGFYLTDELFGITIARPGPVQAHYTYGAAVVASPLWALGTALGIVLGNILPLRVVSALSVALYGMFIAIIIPPCRTSRPVALVVVASFVLSFLFSRLSIFSALSSGTKVIILTVVIAAAAALLFPVKEEDDAPASEKEDSHA